MSTSQTCKLCGETVTGVSQTGDSVRFEPCGHSVPEDATKHWRKKEAVEDTYVPEDIAARDAVDQAPERITVSCNEACGAFVEPATLDEHKAALEHWISHESSWGGCSHGR